MLQVQLDGGAPTRKGGRPDQVKPRVSLDPVLTDLRGVMQLAGASANGVGTLIKSGVIPRPIYLGKGHRMRRWNLAEVRARLESISAEKRGADK